MPRFAAFLRAVNVSGRRLTNARLAACFEGAGLEEVATFRASGNVVFSAEESDAAKLTPRIERGLERELGYEVPAYLRTRAQVRAIAAHEPFEAKLLVASKGKLQVALLGRKPTASTRRKALSLASEEDRLSIRGSELYWLPPGGLMESELDQDALAQILGPVTVRTKGTVEQLAAKYFS